MTRWERWVMGLLAFSAAVQVVLAALLYLCVICMRTLMGLD